MNGERIIRKYMERVTDVELFGLHEAAKKDDSSEALVVRLIGESELAYRLEKHTKEIRKALDQLGEDGYVRTEWLSGDRIKVYIYNDYFGIWDTTKKTFVD